MKSTEIEIHDYEVVREIRLLERFLNELHVERALLKYAQDLKHPGEIYRTNFLASRHPWMAGLQEFAKLESQGRSIKKHLSKKLYLVASDGRKLSVLSRHMPEAVKERFRSTLLDFDRAKDFIFELSTAWNFHGLGCEIDWNSRFDIKGPEFSVRSESFQFDIECKRPDLESAKKVRRADFYHFADIIIPALYDGGYCGAVEIVHEKRLPSSIMDQKSIARDILLKAESGCIDGEFNVISGTAAVRLSRVTGRPVDFERFKMDFLRDKDLNTQGVCYARSLNRLPVDPIKITCRSRSAKSVLINMRSVLADACDDQLDGERYGVIALHIPEIADFEKLASESGLQAATMDVFKSTKRRHLIAVIYSSDLQIKSKGNVHSGYFPAIVFMNPWNTDEEVRKFRFLSRYGISGD